MSKVDLMQMFTKISIFAKTLSKPSFLRSFGLRVLNSYQISPRGRGGDNFLANTQITARRSKLQKSTKKKPLEQ